MGLDKWEELERERFLNDNAVRDLVDAKEALKTPLVRAIELAAEYADLPAALVNHWYDGMVLADRHYQHKGWIYFVRNAETPMRRAL